MTLVNTKFGETTLTWFWWNLINFSDLNARHQRSTCIKLKLAILNLMTFRNNIISYLLDHQSFPAIVYRRMPQWLLWCQLQTIMYTASSLCSNTNECDQNCVLLDGVEQCSCDKGYSLTDDGLTCQGLLKRNYTVSATNYLVYFP